MPDAYVLDDYTTLDLTTNDQTSTATPVAGIQGVTIVPAVSIEQLYTADSIKIEEQKQFEAAVNVEVEYSLWDEDASVVQQWLGGAGSSATSLTDSSDPQKFDISGTFDSVGGDRTLDVTVTGITFPEMPIIDTERGEFVSRNLSGTGEDITDLSMTDNTA